MCGRLLPLLAQYAANKNPGSRFAQTPAAADVEKRRSLCADPNSVGPWEC